ncbi:MAG: acetylhydrolase [Leptothrix sp. (in: Bacteria)]|nr:acetylhydrolase [Leptothrix sp. (in: b-proteobacteria)]
MTARPHTPAATDTATAGRRACLGLGLAAAIAAAAPHRAWAALTADDGGVEGFGAVDLDWVDAARERAVPVRLYLPDRHRATPLVVFSHGIGGSRRGYSWLGSHFASHGIASLHLQHVGSDRQLWAGSVFGLVGRLQDAAQDGEAIHRVLDLRFALDTLLAGELAGRIDTSRIVAAGHSYGANTTLLASGARVARQGRVVDLHDARVRAAIVISAPPFYGEADARAVLSPVRVPSLHVTATEDVIRIPGYYSGAEDRVKVFDAVGSARKWLAVYEGGSHSMFTDRRGSGGAALNPRVKQATRALVLHFLHGVFDNDESGLAAWPRQHAGRLARFSTAGGA